MDLLGRTGIMATHFVRNPFILPYRKPVFSAVGSSSFQYAVQVPDKIFGQTAAGFVYDIVYASEMIDYITREGA